ncbi:DUF4352 domain-containing protein [Humibacter ginsenosidimutans]|uniref:DUF4352 domain-containing protein n=1 Tax=Humibacter ginsenosidimutans TaxID=2599293 RepID=A0A5B8M9F1_9MICO|nr:DUF4352 domain-containing protein [Humibacter ginsenosidimutans]QDZ16285.1 DUF4352 domain-containing protein [Humibacter ginsenosidimutans]
MIKNTTTRSFRSWPRPLRILSLVAAGVLALAIIGASAFAGYTAFLAPPLAKAQQEQCDHSFSSDAGRAACVAGHPDKAKAADRTAAQLAKQHALVKRCQSQYDDLTAQTDCANGDTASADADQAAADKAAADAEKAATAGQSYDNPVAVGTHVSMQNTNRLDGSVVTYSEWISGFNADWRGYDEFEAPDAGMKYVAFVVHVQATDAGVDAGAIAYDASFTDATGNVYDHADAEFEAKPQMPQVTLGAGQQTSGVVVFQVPASVSTGVATFGDGTVFEAVR